MTEQTHPVPFGTPGGPPPPPPPGGPPSTRPPVPGKRTKGCVENVTGTLTVAGVNVGTVGVTRYLCTLDTCPATTLDIDGDGWQTVVVNGGAFLFDTLAHFQEWAAAQS